MKMRKSVVWGVVAGVLIVGGIGFAHTIPGVDVPYDEANYYNPLTISYPDSAPSVFTMRDLAGSGYQVQDVPLNKKSIIEQIKTLMEMFNNVTKVGNDEKDLKVLSAKDISNHYDGVDQILKTTMKTADSNHSLTSGDVLKAFQPGTEIGMMRGSSTSQATARKAQAEILDTTYKNSVDLAKNIANEEDEIKLLEEALNRLNNSSGALDNEQILAQIQSINDTLEIKKNILASNILALKTLENQLKNNEKVRAQAEARESFAFSASDPYNPTVIETSVYSKPKGQGMVDFK